MDIGDRLKILRKDQNLTQQEFADSLGVQRGAVASWEVKRTVPNTPSLTLICKTFGVNREWLETGTGEMYQPMSDNARLAEWLGEVLRGSVEADIRLQLITCLSKLGDDEWKTLHKIALEWAAANKAAADDEKKEG